MPEEKPEEEILEPTLPDEAEDEISENTVLEAKGGDLNAKHRVVLAYIPMLNKQILSRLRVSKDEREDLRSEGILALYDAIVTWNPEASRFAPHAYYSVWKRVIRYLNVLRGKSARGGKRTPTKEVPLPKTFEKSLFQHVQVPQSPEEAIMKRQEAAQGAAWEKLLRDYLENLPGRSGEIMRAVYLDQKIHSEVAQEFGVSRTTVTNVVNNTLEKMRQDIGKKLQEARADPVNVINSLYSNKRTGKRPSLSEIEERGPAFLPQLFQRSRR